MVSRTAIYALACAAFACAADPTQVIVVVDSDLRTPAELDEIRITVTSPEGEEQSASGTLLAGDPPLPRTLALSHTQGPLGTFRAMAEGLRAGTVIVEREARFDFQSERVLVLSMHLLRSCANVVCDRGSTCTERGCEPVPSEALQEWTGSPPRLMDAGPGDGGVDASRDAGRDVGFDACMPQLELCNGRDEDCDGAVDEGFDEIADTCEGGIDDDCDGRVDEGAPETCDTEDNDCDGIIDEELAGTLEVCDTLDQDCDGIVDEGLEGTTETCDGVDQDCDGITDEGFDLASDPTHCGRCDVVCSFMNGAGSCISGTCVLESCVGTFANCDGRIDNGCEVDTNRSTSNCGTCSNECGPPTRECCSGVCSRGC